jgi:photosystem II stability/assembly factor-like uncharacterized protein
MKGYSYLLFSLLLICIGGFKAEAEDWKPFGPWGGSYKHLVAHPSDWKILYAAGSNFHNDFYRTFDGGKTWKHMRYGDVVRINPLNPEELILSWNSEIFVSDDKGITFRHISDLPGGNVARDLQFHSQNPSIVYAIHAFSGDIKTFVSQNGGLTWETRSFPGNFADGIQLTVDPSNGNTLYLLLVEEDGSNVIWKSLDGGNRWERKNEGLSCCSKETQSIVIDPKNPNVLYAVGPQGIFKSINSGNHWFSTKCHCSVQSITINRNNPNQLFAVGSNRYADEDRTPFTIRSNDGGKSWFQLNLPQAEAWSYQEIISSLDQPNVVYVSAPDKGFFRSNDGGKTWNDLPGRGLDYLSSEKIVPDLKTAGHIMTISSGILMETFDFGKNWKTVQGIGNDKVLDVQIHPQSSSYRIVQTPSYLAVTTNGGKTWEYRKLQSEYPIFFLHPADINTILRMNAGGLSISTDLGLSWKRSLTVPRKDIVDVGASGNSKNILYAITYFGSLYRSSNKGISWQLVSALPDLHQAEWIEVHPEKPNVLLMGVFYYTDTAYRWKVLKSSDSGKNWRFVLDNGAQSLVFNQLNPKQVFATWGPLIISNDEGETWTSFYPQPEDLIFSVVGIAPWNTNFIFVSSYPNLEFHLQ